MDTRLLLSHILHSTRIPGTRLKTHVTAIIPFKILFTVQPCCRFPTENLSYFAMHPVFAFGEFVKICQRKVIWLLCVVSYYSSWKVVETSQATPYNNILYWQTVWIVLFWREYLQASSPLAIKGPCWAWKGEGGSLMWFSSDPQSYLASNDDFWHPGKQLRRSTPLFFPLTV